MGRWLIKPNPNVDEYVWFSTISESPISPPLSRVEMAEFMEQDLLEEVRERVSAELRAADESDYQGDTELVMNTPGGESTDGYYRISDMGEVARILREADQVLYGNESEMDSLIIQLTELRVSPLDGDSHG